MDTRKLESRSGVPGSLALAFANTLPGSPSAGPDPFATPSDAVRWISENVPSEAGVPGPGTPWAPPMARELHGEALRLRDAIHNLFCLVTTHQPVTSPALDEINRVVGAATWSRRIVIQGDTLCLHETTLALRPLGALAPVGCAAAELATTADPTRLRRCAAPACSRWFVDTSKGGRRRWCSMATCGNRAKAARWRDRHPS
jgi:predicted RNA-binding Zn ribbon-like protein